MAWEIARVELRRLARYELLGVNGVGRRQWLGRRLGRGVDIDSPCLQDHICTGVLGFGSYRCMLPFEGQLLHQASWGNSQLPFLGM